MLKTGLFAGSFDPFTMGHYDIVSRAAQLFDKLYIGVATDTGNKQCRDIEERTQITKLSVQNILNVEVLRFSGFLVDFAAKVGAEVIVRGLRTGNDFEYEKALSEVYRSQNDRIETLFLISSHAYCHISGSTVRELARLGGKLDGYVCKPAEEAVRELYRANTGDR